MQTTVVQKVVLVTYGNAYLSGKSLPENFYPGNSAFAFTHAMDFVDVEAHGDHYHLHDYAADPVAFFKRLQDEGYTSLRLVYEPSDSNLETPDWMMCGFVGGGARWLIEATGPAGCDYWEAREETVEEPVGDRIWYSSYGRIAKHLEPVTHGSSRLLEVKNDLKLNLTLISAFARKHEAADFADNFDKALAALDSDTPLADVYHKDIVRADLLPLDALRLLGAAQNAWVFGGMGSWNDMVFEGVTANEYNNLSSGLYLLLLDAVSEAANTSI